MIYLVSNEQRLFESDVYKIITITESLEMLESCDMLQYDSETTGRDAHINKLLCAQFGDIEGKNQIIVDCTTVDIRIYKEILESKYLIGQNIKFDLKFLYNYGIVPLKVYDTMIVEQLIYLGFPYLLVGATKEIILEYAEYMSIHREEFKIRKIKPEVKKCILYRDIPKSAEFIYEHSGVSLKAIAYRYLGIDIDKTIRGEIIWRGLDDSVIKYAAGDVIYLAEIMRKQLEVCKKLNCVKGVMLECNAVPSIAYVEWCGIRLSPLRWKIKMENDWKNLQLSIKEINNFVINEPKLKEFIYIDNQGDLFKGFNTEPQVKIDWASSTDVIKVAKRLGFDTTVIDKSTGEEKDSAMEKVLKGQKGVCDEFLRLYFGKGEPEDEDYFPGYSGSFKVVTSFGQGHLNAINPNTGRIHTNFNQLGTDSGRMSCGSKDINTDLALLKGLPTKVSNKKKEDIRKSTKCSYPNMQQLPADTLTRGSFIPNKGNLLVDCDYAALESRLGADIYNEPAMIEEYLYGSGDMHSLTAKKCFPLELKDIPIEDIKKLRPDLRKKAKAPEFAMQFGGSPYAIMASLGCTLEEATIIANAYWQGFPGVASFKEKGSRFVRNNGYVLMNAYTGHKMFWWDFLFWKKEKASFTSEFWENYRLYHKGNKNDPVVKKVSHNAKIASKWDRMALNSPTQGTGATIIKKASTDLFKWIVTNNYFNKILICNIVHDELLVEFPKELKNTFPPLLEKIMSEASSTFCKKLPIPAEAEVAGHWLH